MSEPSRELLRRLSEHLGGPAEIAVLLQVDPNTVNVWKRRPNGFPSPVRRLRSVDLWDLRDVQDWAAATGRLPEPTDPTPTNHAPEGC